MARPPRLQAPGTVHHIIARGNERRDVFVDDTDRLDYLDRLAQYRAKFGFRLYAFCLMPNHVHLAVEQGPMPLSAVMHALQSSYTQFFNRRHRRVGHLFQGRYKSFLVDRDRYFLALVRYIHENPVKAGIVRTAHLYRWSSDRFFRRGKAPPWFDLDRAFELLGSDRAGGVRRYRTFDVSQSGSSYEQLPIHEGSVKGAEEFAVAALRHLDLPRRRKHGWTAEAVAQFVAASDGMTLADLAGPSRRRKFSRSRILTAYLGLVRFGIPVAEAARLFRRNESTLARAVRFLDARLTREPDLRDRVARIAAKAERHA